MKGFKKKRVAAPKQAAAKNRSLVNRLVVILSVTVLIAFILMDGILTKTIGDRMLDATDVTMFNISEKNVAEVDGVINEIDLINNNIQSALSQMYQQEDDLKAGITATWQMDGEDASLLSDTKAKFMSRITGTQIPGSRFEAESSILNSLASIVGSYDSVNGAGVFLEPGAFSESIEGDYAPFMNKADLAEGVFENLAYESYANADYYAPAKETLKGGFTDAYEEDGVMMVSAYYPILLDGAFMGVVNLDLNAEIFSVIASEEADFPSMYVNLVNNNESILYSTHSDVIGKAFQDTVPAETYQKIAAKWAEGKAFKIRTSSTRGTVWRFYEPMENNGETWWIQTVVSKSDYTKTRQEMAFLVAGCALLIMLLLVLTIIYRLRRALKPLETIGKAAEEVADGHLNVEISYQSNDEIGRLATSISTVINRIRHIIRDLSNILQEVASGNFNPDLTSHAEYYKGDYAPLMESLENITTELSETMQGIRDAAAQVSSGSDQVASGAQALAQGSTEQASSVEELSQTMSGIAEKISATTEMTKEAAEISAGSNAAVQISNDKMGEMSASMTEITDKAGEIGKIIKTIDDIAFQTNILALNASIEAARAGSAGKGFAVVADEVGNLAKKSQEAAQDTAKLIEDTITAVSKGAGITDETAQALGKVSESFTRIDALVSQISTASEQQNIGVQQVSQGIDQIASVVQTNSATAEESAATSEELSSQANLLSDLVSGFQLKRK